MKISLEGLSNRSEQAEERIYKLKDRLINIVQFEEQEKKLRKMNRAQDNKANKHNSIYIMGVPGGEKKKKALKIII